MINFLRQLKKITSNFMFSTFILLSKGETEGILQDSFMASIQTQQ